MCGMNAWAAQWLGGIYIFEKTYLKVTVLLHKTAFVNFQMAITGSKAGFHKFFLFSSGLGGEGEISLFEMIEHLKSLVIFACLMDSFVIL